MANKHSYDIVVAGGGLAGICASIAAARCGARVALVHDRPLLGGNASGELRVHVAGADCSGSAIAGYARESGIIDEIRLENLKKNPANSADVFSLILREYVRAEPNIELFMNTRVRRVQMRNKDTIEALEADQLTTEKEYLFRANIFIDCTGDGFIGAKAGANFRIGREAQQEFGESLAPEKSDSKTLPSCVEFYLKDMGQPVEFEPPPWAYRYETDDDLPHRGVEPEHWQFTGLNGGFWWLSAGGDRSTIADNENIYEELLKVLLGIWDIMKNRGDHGVANYALNWISPVPGKRESRRFEGRYRLNQNDLLDGKIFDDRVAYGGWPIDIHPPEGIFSKEPPNIAVPLKRPYTIPLRCLYSKNISNLMFAGRNASFTHVGLGSARVMATCAAAGQAAGVAAAVALRKKKIPHQIQQDHIQEVQQLLLQQGAFIPCCTLNDPADLAKSAQLSASSEGKLEVSEDKSDQSLKQSFSFEQRLFQLFPVSDKRIDFVEALISSDRQLTLKASLMRAKDIWDFSADEKPGKVLAKATVQTGENDREWLRFPFGLNHIEPGLFWIIVEAADNGQHVRWLGRLDNPVGLVRGRFEAFPCARPELVPNYQTIRGTFIFRLAPESKPYSVQNVTNGVTRPERWPNLWVSEAPGEKPEWIELTWPKQVTVSHVCISFDGQFDSNVTWPAPLGVFGCKILPSVVKNYDISARINDKWLPLCKVKNNYHYRRVHSFELIKTHALRITVRETNGVNEARIFEVRVYCN